MEEYRVGKNDKKNHPIFSAEANYFMKFTGEEKKPPAIIPSKKRTKNP